MRQILAARWVVPIDGPVIDDGEVVIEDGIIQTVRPRTAPASDVRDIGNAVILPGLINAHTHLEYTAQRGFLEDVPFFPWIRALTAAKARLDREDWLASARLGALESLAAGMTTIGDNTDAGVTAQIASETGMRGVIYQEFFGIDPREDAIVILENLSNKLAALKQYESDRVQIAISPHAPYTVRPELFTALHNHPELQHYRTSIHLAESPAEAALIKSGMGPFGEMLERRGIPWAAYGGTPTEYLNALGAVRKGALLVHCVHQTEDDISLVEKSGASIVHCPKSNGKLGAGIAPLGRWLEREGLNIALGTDSAVSNNTLDLFEEMRFALLTARAVSTSVEAVLARDVLRMATIGGARALGVDTAAGSLTPGKRADITVVNLQRAHTVPATDPESAIVYSARAEDVALTMCDGVILYDNGVWPGMDPVSVTAEAEAVRRKCAST